MTYAEWLREGEDELAKTPAPTREEDLALRLALDAENAEGAADADDADDDPAPVDGALVHEPLP